MDVTLRIRTPPERLRHYASKLTEEPSATNILATIIGLEMVAAELEREAAIFTPGGDREPVNHACPHCQGSIVLLYPADDAESAVAARDNMVEAYNQLGELLEEYVLRTSGLMTRVWPHDPAKLQPSDKHAALLVEDHNG